MKDCQHERDREAYNEMASEMRANDMNPPTFDEWLIMRARLKEFFANQHNRREGESNG